MGLFSVVCSIVVWCGVAYQSQVERGVAFVLSGHLVEHVPGLLGLVRETR